MRKLIFVALLSALAPSALAAQADPLSAQSRYLHEGMKAILLRSAERMPEERYAYRPTPDVRSFAEILGHVADMQYMYCAVVLGERNPATRIDVAGMTKSQVIAALTGALTYCDRAYATLTDSTAAEMVTFMGGPVPKLGLLNVNHLHGVLHYGNLVTYLRLNGLVPPTSDPGFLPSGS